MSNEPAALNHRESPTIGPSSGSASSLLATESLWLPKEKNILPLPWADFHEMYERGHGVDSDLMETSGTLQIEGRCLYLDEFRTEQHRPNDLLRWALSLPKDLVQYDDSAQEFWVHRRLGPIGPFASGEEVITVDISWSRIRSSACGGHRVLRAPTIELCTDRHRYPCSITSYASTHGVLPSEAQRRLERIPQMEAILAELREAEPLRTAGWGIDLSDPFAKVGESFVAWLELTGYDQPNQAAQGVAAEHPDVEIRTGASTSYAALAEALLQFADGRGIYLPNAALSGVVNRFELSQAVAGAWINHRANILEVGVDTRWIPHDVASVLLTGSPDSYDDGRWAPEEELHAAIAEELQNRIDVPFTVVYGWLDRDDRSP